MKKGILKTLTSATGQAHTSQPNSMPVAPKRAKGSPVLANAEKALRDLAGDSIVNLDPHRIEPSPFRDRMEEDAEAREQQDELKRSVLKEGQKIPVLVRPHPSKPNCYQLAYGHRRWKAIKEIAAESDRPETVFLRAYVRDLTDAELIHEQTIENGVRENLSWIEKALWAQQLKSTGIRQREMTSLLGVSEAEVSRLFKVLNGVPEAMIRAIGRADGIGRPSWLELAEKMEAAPDKLETALALSQTADFASLDSPKRFDLVIRAFGGNARNTNQIPKAATEVRLGQELICSAKSNRTGFQLSFPKSQNDFGEWLSQNMERIYTDFAAQKADKSND